MTERIIVGLNGSESSEYALAWAAKRAEQRGAELVLVHIIDRGVGLFDAPEFIRGARERGQELVENARAAAERIAPGTRITSELREDDGIPAGFAELSESAALIVVGSDSTGVRADRGERGRHSFRVAAGSSAPVIVIPDIDVSQRSGVVVGVDGSEVSENAIEYAAAEADSLGDPLIAVSAWMQPATHYGSEYAYTPEVLEAAQESSTKMLAEAMRSVARRYPALEIQRIVVNGDPANALLEQAENARLLVVGSHGRGTFRRLLLGSVSHSVLGTLVAPTVVHR